MKYKHLAVIGRIPGDDEDSVYFFNDMTEEEARKAFENAIYADTGWDKTPSYNFEQWGVSCYVNAILASDTEIQGISLNY